MLVLLFAVSLFFWPGCSDSDSDTAPSPEPTQYSFKILGSLGEGSRPVIGYLEEEGIVFVESGDDEHYGIALDGDGISPDEIMTDDDIKKNMAEGKALLIMNCTAAHKEALMKYTGILFGDDDTTAYCIIPISGTLNRMMAIVEHPVLREVDPSELIESLNTTGLNVEFDEDGYYSSLEERRKEFEDHTGPKMFAEKIYTLLEENREINAGLRATESDSYPSELKYRTWRYTRDTSWTIDNAWLKYSGSYLSWVMPAYAPMVGYQTLTLTPTTNVSLYLDNDSANANGDYQWLTIDYIGASNPATDHSTYVKSTSIDMPINGEDYQVYDGNEYIKAWGYAQMECLFNLYPYTTSPDPTTILRFYDAEPPNENNVTTYSAGYKFDVGVSAAGANTTCSITRSTNTEIPDWAVENKTNNAGLNFLWKWHSANPSYTSDFDKLNTLNINLFQPNASVVMQTRSLSTDKLQFWMENGISQISWCGQYKVSLSSFDRWDLGKLTDLTIITIDLNKVLYAIAEKLSISPEQVQGGTSTTGTVTIDQAAPTGGATVTLTSSNSNWASVPDTVVVPEGVASATFPITTYAVTGNSAATIKATLEGVTVSADVTVTP